MKTFILLLIAQIFIKSVNCQDLIFSINQSGVAYKDNATKQYNDAEVKNSDITITLQNKIVKIKNNNTSVYALEKMNGENNNSRHLHTQIWKATDNNKNPVQFKFTVNLENREAMVEVTYKDYRNYYFGKYINGNSKDPLPKEADQPTTLN